MNIKQEKEGEVIIFFEACLWSLFPVVTAMALKNVSVLVSLGWSMLFASLFFAVVITYKKKWPDVGNREVMGDVLLSTLLLGVIYYLLYFSALRYTSPGNASLIALIEIFFSYLFFHAWRKEQMPKEHVVGAILMLVGAGIVFYPNFSEFHLGDILILGASAVAPFGNHLQRRARQKVCSESILLIRCFVSAVAIFLFAFIVDAGSSFAISKKDFVLLIVNGVFLLGLSKLLWVEGIHRISVTKALALSSLAPLLTLLLSWGILHLVPTSFQLFSFVPMFFGIILLSKKIKN